MNRVAWDQLIEPQTGLFLKRVQIFPQASYSSMASLLPAFAPWLFRQPEPHQAGHFIRATLSLAVVNVVQKLVVPCRCQQTQVRMRVMVGLLLGAAVPLTCYLEGKKKA